MQDFDKWEQRITQVLLQIDSQDPMNVIDSSRFVERYMNWHCLLIFIITQSTFTNTFQIQTKQTKDAQ